MKISLGNSYKVYSQHFFHLNPQLNLNQDLKNEHLCLLQHQLQDIKNLNLCLPHDQKIILAHTKTKNEKRKGVFDGTYIEYKSESDKPQSIKEYLQNIRPYLRDIINCLRTCGARKVQPIMRITFMSSKKWRRTPGVF